MLFNFIIFIVSIGFIVNPVYSQILISDPIKSLPEHMARDLQNKDFILHIYNPQKEVIAFYWKDDSRVLLKTLGRLKQYIEKYNKHLLFAMNGGMYHRGFSPVGLYIANNIQYQQLNMQSGAGNFFIQPNGVFYCTKDDKPGICLAKDYYKIHNVKHATQSGPMLLINKRINPYFSDTSGYFNIRNGVGISKRGKLIFAMSRKPITLYEFANYFKKQQCEQALYLDGSISRTYAPYKRWVQLDGAFGVMIGVLKR